MNKKTIGSMICGASAGLINGLFGAGAGILTVPLLKRLGGLSTVIAHATSIAIVLPLCASSSLFYVLNKNVTPADALPFILGGLIGAPLGAILLKKAPEMLLRRAFGAFMIYSAVRILL